VFVILLKWGVTGAAAATVISQGFSGLGIGLYVMMRNRELLEFPWKLGWKRIRAIMKNDVLTGL
jgi:Na+-driven multidrug efflux pump